MYLRVVHETQFCHHRLYCIFICREATGKQFSATVLRYLCTWCPALPDQSSLYPILGFDYDIIFSEKPLSFLKNPCQG